MIIIKKTDVEEWWNTKTRKRLDRWEYITMDSVL